MKTTKFTVYYKNGNEENIYTTSVYLAAILATARAIENGNDFRISYIKDNDNQKVYGEIELNLSMEQK